MKSVIGHAREYLEIFYAFFDSLQDEIGDSETDRLAADFFENNARRYLNLPVRAIA
ncbi:MAG: hypothetical protein ABJH07_15530 [Sedimentitalea sp.]|uniref:hypothetical protein n=1 Tax=Sedimentitalea sp. TaxID=2048915 RepID=UPI00326659F2